MSLQKKSHGIEQEPNEDWRKAEFMNSRPGREKIFRLVPYYNFMLKSYTGGPRITRFQSARSQVNTDFFERK